MSWSQLLDRRVPPHLVADPQAEKTHALPRRTPSVKVTAKPAAAGASFSAIPTAILRKKLHELKRRFLPVIAVAALPLQSS
jgi:hypothetical protein